MNLIGGLDSFDGGDIISFGNSLSAFSALLPTLLLKKIKPVEIIKAKE